MIPMKSLIPMIGHTDQRRGNKEIWGKKTIKETINNGDSDRTTFCLEKKKLTESRLLELKVRT